VNFTPSLPPIGYGTALAPLASRPAHVGPVNPAAPIEYDRPRERARPEHAREGEFIGGARRFRFETLRESRVFVAAAAPVDDGDIRAGTPPRLPPPIASYLLHSAPVIAAGENVGRLFDDYV
jgi:hypothetical protein